MTPDTRPTSQAGETAEGKAGKSKAPVNLFSPENAPPFYAKAARVAFEKLPNSGTGQSILATLKNAGVKDDEIKRIGLDDFLRGKFFAISYGKRDIQL